MKKFVSVLLFILIIITACANLASSHPGRTDSKGGHYNRSTGEYHYHHGMSAHQHPNGVCPYGISEATTTRYYNSYSSNTNIYTTSKPHTSKYIEHSNKEDDIISIIFNYIIVGLFLVYIIVRFILKLSDWKRKNK